MPLHPLQEQLAFLTPEMNSLRLLSQHGHMPVKLSNPPGPHTGAQEPQDPRQLLGHVAGGGGEAPQGVEGAPEQVACQARCLARWWAHLAEQLLEVQVCHSQSDVT